MLVQPRVDINEFTNTVTFSCPDHGYIGQCPKMCSRRESLKAATCTVCWEVEERRRIAEERLPLLREQLKRRSPCVTRRRFTLSRRSI